MNKEKVIKTLRKWSDRKVCAKGVGKNGTIHIYHDTDILSGGVFEEAAEDIVDLYQAEIDKLKAENERLEENLEFVTHQRDKLQEELPYDYFND